MSCPLNKVKRDLRVGHESEIKILSRLHIVAEDAGSH